MSRRILKQVAAAGHQVGTHTWSHQMLNAAKGRFKVPGGKTEVREFNPKDEIEKGISAVHWAVGGPTAPFFRFPGLKHPPELVTYLGERNIGIFSTDFDSFDFKMRKARAGAPVGDDEAEEIRQGHRPDARFPARDRRSDRGPAQRPQGRRLQDRRHEAEVRGHDAARL